MKELFKHIKRLVGGICIVGILMAIGAGLYELWVNVVSEALGDDVDQLFDDIEKELPAAYAAGRIGDYFCI